MMKKYITNSFIHSYPNDNTLSKQLLSAYTYCVFTFSNTHGIQMGLTV